ncbi:GtrA family protein [Arthrobacter sp. RT-1]|uniref:GtrA family protein n=1 Tax=Arthrobacter sp. RT-1 TaxID=2292263 RepID=UPI000E1F50A5|nr:GtrA family protein [Arthrobacter sp. RT-1]RDV08088.1 GtrA family protein [Arthrobacter sp. RT-1]
MIFGMKQLPQRSFKDLHWRQLPFTFSKRLAAENKASWRNRPLSLYQAASLRLGRMTRFAAVGALGTVVNLLVMALLVHDGVAIGYVAAAVIAAEISILHNFLLQERFVFRDLRDGTQSWQGRLTQHLLFNNVEALIRLPFLILLVETMHVLAVLAQAVTLAIAFIARFLFASRVVYRPKLVKQDARHRAAGDRVEEVSA